ncbi:MAG: hypothetical protein LBB75_05515 [Oscillospiraceae bacterium]|nr:hypothetical protein [Oscillospiraceae bacterium]
MLKKFVMIPFCTVFAFVNFMLDAAIRPLLDTHQEQAYFVMFEALARDDKNFIAVDLSGALLEDTSKFVEMMQAWCDAREIAFMLDDWKGLDEKGFVKANDDPDSMMGVYVVGGILIEFRDVSLTRNTLVTNTGAAGAGAGYRTTIRRVHGKWVITERKMTWIV